jgi:hypothetical protein
MSDTDVSELDPRERETLPPPEPRSTGDLLEDLEVTIAEVNAASLQAKHAADCARAAADRCTDQVVQLIQRIRENEAREADRDQRIYNLERDVADLRARAGLQ